MIIITSIIIIISSSSSSSSIIILIIIIVCTCIIISSMITRVSITVSIIATVTCLSARGQLPQRRDEWVQYEVCTSFKHE